MTPELDAEKLAKKVKDTCNRTWLDRLSDGDNEQNAVSVSVTLSPNNKKKQNVSVKTFDTDSFFAQLTGLLLEADKAMGPQWFKG